MSDNQNESEEQAMINSVVSMFGAMGIEGVQFGDDPDGFTIDTIKPPDVPHDLPTKDGTVSVKQGDRIRLLSWAELKNEWYEDGIGKVLAITPKDEDSVFSIAYQDENAAEGTGPTSCTLRPRNDVSWARVIEKLD